MLDKNGTLIQAGDIVEIKNAYFKSDNGFWYVEQDGTNPACLSDDLTLFKIGKTGKLSTAKNNIAFWPLVSFVSDSRKSAAADKWNQKHATIEVTDKVDNAQVIARFRELVTKYTASAEQLKFRGFGPMSIKNHTDNVNYYSRAVKRMELKSN